MITPRGMRWIDAQSIQENDTVLRDGKLTRVVRLEWPYAVIRIFDPTSQEFGDRKITRLEGRYFVPSRQFLREAGVYESRLLALEEPDSFVIDLASAIEMGPNGARITTSSLDSDDDVDVAVGEIADDSASEPEDVAASSDAEVDAPYGVDPDGEELDVEIEESDVSLQRQFEDDKSFSAMEWPRKPGKFEVRAGDELSFEWFASEPTLERAGKGGSGTARRPRPSF